MNKLTAPKSVPESLRPLFETNVPGRLVEQSKLDDPMFQEIRRYHANLPEVGHYTKLVMAGDTEKTSEFGTVSVVSAKSHMISAVLAFYNKKRPNNAAAKDERIAELEEQLRRKDLALAALVAKVAKLEGRA